MPPRAEWLVAKYIPNLRRREPENIGVILYSQGRMLSRFLGERADGRIDGRRLRFVAAPVPNYKAWIAYWRDAIQRSSEAPDLRSLISQPSDENYYLEYGGATIVGDASSTPESTLDWLYGTLVEDQPDPDTLDVAKLSEAVLNRLDVAQKVERDYRFPVPLSTGVEDSIIFDYRYVNSAVHLMQRVTLTWEDERSWNSVHAATWNFRFAHNDERPSLIALVRPRAQDQELSRQLGVIGEHATIVDVRQTERAASLLRDLLHLEQATL
jgi:hypothetical protein